MWRTVQRSLAIVVVSAAVGLAVNAVSPRRIPYITPPKPVIAESEFIPLEFAHKQFGVAIFLDARAPSDYAAGHIAGAFNVPAEQFGEHFPQVASYLAPDSPIICYCDGMECELSHHLAEQLRQQGFKDIHILQNGWTVWSKAGYPTQP